MTIEPDERPPHPGEILREDFLPQLGLTRTELARHLQVPRRRLDDVLGERRPVTLDLAQRLDAALGTGARYWLGLQAQHDIWRAESGAPAGIRPLAWPSTLDAGTPVRQR